MYRSVSKARLCAENGLEQKARARKCDTFSYRLLLAMATAHEKVNCWIDWEVVVSGCWATEPLGGSLIFFSREKYILVFIFSRKMQFLFFFEYDFMILMIRTLRSLFWKKPVASFLLRMWETRLTYWHVENYNNQNKTCIFSMFWIHVSQSIAGHVNLYWPVAVELSPKLSDCKQRKLSCKQFAPGSS